MCDKIESYEPFVSSIKPEEGPKLVLEDNKQPELVAVNIREPKHAGNLKRLDAEFYKSTLDAVEDAIAALQKLGYSVYINGLEIVITAPDGEEIYLQSKSDFVEYALSIVSET